MRETVSRSAERLALMPGYPGMQSFIDWLGREGAALGPVITAIAAIGLAIPVALLIHRLGMAVLRRVASHQPDGSGEVFLAEGCRPAKWITAALAVILAQRAAPLDAWAADVWRQAAGFIMPALFGWLAIAIVRALRKVIESRADISVVDNLQARRKRTRVGILGRIMVVVILFLTLCMMLISIPGVRNVGVTLMASAGLAGLAVGAAAQPALKNLIAGVQMAFTEPIRIDDVVIIGGEWGRIEDIRLTFVVVKVWDERRLVVPVSKFLEESFQNWTRESAQLLGSASFYLDPTADVGRLRTQLGKIVEANPLWDGRFFNLQVTDTKPDAMEVRALVTAADAGKAFDLRCDAREAMMKFVTETMPEALPRHRLTTSGPWAATAHSGQCL